MRELVGVDQMGGTMRLGKYPCRLTPASRAWEMYGSDEVWERHRHRYEVNPEYVPLFEEKGLVVSGKSPDRIFVEVIEFPTTRGSWPASSTPSSSRGPTSRTRSSSPSSAPRSSTAITGKEEEAEECERPLPTEIETEEIEKQAETGGTNRPEEAVGSADS